MAWTAGVLAPGRVRAEDKSTKLPPFPDAPTSGEKKSPLPPETLTKVNDVLKKAAVIKRKQFDATMTAEIASIKQDSGTLNADETKGLEAAADKAKDAALEDFTARCLQEFREAYARDGKGSLDWVTRPDIPNLAAGSNGPTGRGVNFTGPLDQPAWKEGITRALMPEQIAVWEKARDERKNAVAKAIDSFLATQLDRFRPGLETPVLAQVSEIRDSLDLPKERAEPLAALGKKAVDLSLEAWRQAAAKSLVTKDEEQRNKEFKNKNFNFRFNDKDAPLKQPAWTEGLAKLLTDEDRARLQAVRESHKTRRTHAFTQLIVSLMDEKVAFTASQRPKLEAVLENQVPGHKEFFPDMSNGNRYYYLQQAAFYKAAAALKPEQVHPLLDDLQWKHWQAVGPTGGAGSNDDEEEEAKPAASPGQEPTPAGEPEDVEQAVSDYLQAHVATHYKKVENAMTLRAEDAARVVNLEPPHAARLQTAARGAAEAASGAWVPSLEQNVRGEVHGATLENVRHKLAGASSYYYSEQLNPQDQAVWKTAVKGELTEPQQASWKTECDARSQYNDNALVGYLLAEFDRKYFLLPEQWDKIAPLLATAIGEYRPDIQQMFSYYNSSWYLTSYYMFLPVHAVPEGDLKAILRREQWDRWSGSSEYNYSLNYFENIRRNHEQRVKGKQP